jgi:hypothetical protein
MGRADRVPAVGLPKRGEIYEGHKTSRRAMSNQVQILEIEHFDQPAFCWHCHGRNSILLLDLFGKMVCERCMSRYWNRRKARRKKHRRAWQKIQAELDRKKRKDKVKERNKEEQHDESFLSNSGGRRRKLSGKLRGLGDRGVDGAPAAGREIIHAKSRWNELFEN